MKTDWVAEMFSALRDCGEDISIAFGQTDGAASPGQVRWFEMPHDQFDGISGLAELLKGEGLRVDRLPELRDDRFTFMRGLRGFWSVLPSLAVRRQQWRTEFDWQRKLAFHPVSQRVAWRLFTEQQTASIIDAAKAADVTVNTYLLHRLDKVVSDELVAPGAARRWMIPVNLRGAIVRHSPLPPHMSFIGVDLEGEASLGQVQETVNKLKARGFHWGMWIMLHLGRLLGAEGMRKDIRKREKQHHGVTGMFSNLGSWDIPGGHHWIFCPATTRVYPIGAGCVTMNGRMALALQLHDALGMDFRETDSLLERWRQAVLQEPAAGTGDCADRNGFTLEKCVVE